MNRTLRERVLAAMRRKHGIDEDYIAEQMAQVVKGETVKKVMKPDKDGNFHVVKVEVTTKAEDAARGLVLLDHMHGGRLGLGARSLHLQGDTKKMVVQHAPEVDPRIIWSKDTEVEDSELVDEDE